MLPSRDFLLASEGYGVTTAEIFYRMPDHPALLQIYIWQDYDLAPDFPALFAFLDFWKVNLDARLHSVKFGHNPLLESRRWRMVDREFRLE